MWILCERIALTVNSEWKMSRGCEQGWGCGGHFPFSGVNKDRKRAIEIWIHKEAILRKWSNSRQAFKKINCLDPERTRPYSAQFFPNLFFTKSCLFRNKIVFRKLSFTFYFIFRTGPGISLAGGRRTNTLSTPSYAPPLQILFYISCMRWQICNKGMKET